MSKKEEGDGSMYEPNSDEERDAETPGEWIYGDACFTLFAFLGETEGRSTRAKDNAAKEAKVCGFWNTRFLRTNFFCYGVFLDVKTPSNPDAISNHFLQTFRYWPQPRCIALMLHATLCQPRRCWRLFTFCAWAIANISSICAASWPSLSTDSCANYMFAPFCLI